MFKVTINLAFAFKVMINITVAFQVIIIVPFGHKCHCVFNVTIYLAFTIKVTFLSNFGHNICFSNDLFSIFI